MKNFLPYKESIKMKDLGFDEPCLGAWSNTDNQPEFFYNKKPTKYSKLFTSKSKHCVAPLYQEAFDWFTEHGLFSYINREYTTGKYLYEYSIEDGNGSTGTFGFNSKRIAENACINELLKKLYSNKEYLKQIKRNNKLNELGV